MSNYRKAIIMFVGAAALLLLPSLFLLAVNAADVLGIAMGPNETQIANALRNSAYERSVTVFNPGTDPANVAVGVEGDASTWFGLFNQDDPSKTIQTMTTPARSHANMLVRISIPADAANGKYEATVYAETLLGEPIQTNAGALTKLRATSKFTIEVTGEQIISGEVISTQADLVEVNYPLRINVRFKNTGNVAEYPAIQVNISKSGASVANFNHSSTMVKSGDVAVIPVEWDTTGLDVGDYVASVGVSLGRNSIATSDLPFSILSVGTLTRRGSLESLAYSGKPSLGKMLKIEASFANIGEIQSTASFSGEVYRDGELVNTVQSEAITVAPGKTEGLASYLRVDNAGSYYIKGQVIYEGKRTDIKELSFNIGTDVSRTSGIMWTVVAVAVVASLGVAGFAYRKRKVRS